MVMKTGNKSVVTEISNLHGVTCDVIKQNITALTRYTRKYALLHYPGYDYPYRTGYKDHSKGMNKKLMKKYSFKTNYNT